MKKIVIGIGLVLVLAGIAVWVTNADSSSNYKTELNDFAVVDTSDVHFIRLTDEQGNIVELKRDEKSWSLNDEHKARPDAVNILLSTIRKVTVRAPVSQNQMKSVLKNIISNHTLVEIYDDSESLLKSYYVGGPDKDHTGTNMLMKGSSRPFITHIEGFHGFLTTRFFTNELEWRHRGVFEYKADNIQRIDIRHPDAPQHNVSIEATESGYAVSAGQAMAPVSQLDTFMLSAYLKNYERVHFESFEETKTTMFMDSVLQKGHLFEISLATKGGEIRNVKGYRKPIKEGYDLLKDMPTDYDIDRFYLLIDDKQFVICQYILFDPLLMSLDFISAR